MEDLSFEMSLELTLPRSITIVNKKASIGKEKLGKVLGKVVTGGGEKKKRRGRGEMRGDGKKQERVEEQRGLEGEKKRRGGREKQKQRGGRDT